MYIKQIQIENIRSIAQLTWQIEDRQAAGWHVILGNNGAGKSSFVRAATLVFVGGYVLNLNEDLSRWIRPTQQLQTGESFPKTASVDIQFTRNESLISRYPPQSQLHQESTPNVQQISYPVPLVHSLASSYPGWMPFPSVGVGLVTSDGVTIIRCQISRSRPFPKFPERSPEYNPLQELQEDVDELRKWIGFSAAYGPFRRFTGTDSEYEAALRINPLLARHATAFRENIALTECLQWLRDLRFKQLEEKPEGALLEKLRNFINQEGFLPLGVRMNGVSSDGVEFVDGNGCSVPVSELSDGYRSILSLTLDLVRHLSIAFGQDNLFSEDGKQVMPPGVTLIDEVDAHLHPTWQREIGLWFMRLFPNMQFIVTTHSPLICQAATTIYRLPTPGTEEEGRMITGLDFERLKYGNVLEAYGTEAFGKGVTRSDESKEMQERLAELNVKELENGLTKKEKKEQERLRATLPTTAHSLSPEPVR